MSNHCKICGRQDLNLFIEFDKYPSTISHLFLNHADALGNHKKIAFVKCNYCNHVQISQDMPQDFYEDYVMTVSHSKKMNNFQIEQAEFFINKFGLQSRKVLEIGCGDGNFLMILKGRNCIVYGNEPSKPFRELAKRKGLNVDGQFVNETYYNPHAPFDAVVSREVLEHVPHPVEFLKDIKRQVKEKGAILIEVPNFEKALKDSRYYDMFPDHLSYFTRESLTAAMLISGFKNIEIFYGMDDEFIYATAQNISFESAELEFARTQIKMDFEKIFSEYKHIVVWGAGGKGIAALGSLDDVSRIKYVVDSDTFKKDKYLPSSGLIVKKPSYLFSDKDVDMLIITNLAYTDEIVKLLVQNNFKPKVMSLAKDGIKNIDLPILK